MNLDFPREWLFGNFVETKVVRYDENSNFKLFLDIHEHLGEVQSPGHPGVGNLTQAVPGNDLLKILLKHKLLVMINIVLLHCFRMSMTIWARSRASDNQK